MLSNYRISKFFRPFSFWGYIGVIMIDGNVQIMYFLMFSQSELLFSFDFNDKIIHTLEQLIFFIYMWFSISCYFIYFNIYKKLSKYFLGNSQSSIDGILGLTINCSFRQMCLSAIHSFIRYNPSMQNLMLIGVEIFFILFTFGFSNLRLKFRQLLIVWISLIFSVLRIVFNLILYLEF